MLAQRFFAAMLDINVALLEITDSKALMKNIMRHAAELLDCERCSIFMVYRASECENAFPS